MSEIGQLWVLYVDKTASPLGSYENPDWQYVGGQKNLDFKRALATVDATTKASESNEESVAGTLSRTISLDALYQADDAGLQVLEAAHEARQSRVMKIDNGVLSYKFRAWVTDFPIAAPADGIVDQAITIKVTGKVERTPALTNLIAP